VSISHAHGRTQKAFRNGLNAGVQHFALSNYYPSEPFSPLSDHFTDIPDYVIDSPNAEHHNMGVSRLHLNGLGCTLVSGNEKGVSPVGMASLGITNWKSAITAILNTLQYEDGGGITINHPTWTNLKSSVAMAMLDYDNRVLGIEITNEAGMYDDTAYSYDMWDEILLTGRRCWGFCVPDHGLERNTHWTGRNILLTNDLTGHGCLKAYRDGAFYSKIYDSDLDLDNVSYANGVLSVVALNADKICIIIDGDITTFDSNSATLEIPTGATYVRAEAWKENYNWIDSSETEKVVTDKVFTNPIMLKSDVKKSKKPHRHKIQKIFDL
jgi:hypothetical protein